MSGQDVTPGRSMDPLRPRVVVLVAVCCTTLSAVAGALSMRAWMLDYFTEIGVTASPGPRYYLPEGAAMAALSLLSMAVGGQLLRHRPWWSLTALTSITAAFLIGRPVLVDMLEPLVVATIWTGTLVLWCAMYRPWLARSAPDDLPVASPPGPADLTRAARRAATALVGVVVALVVALIVVNTLGGLQLYFWGLWPGWRAAAEDWSTLLACLAIWAAWLTGRTDDEPGALHRADPRAVTWRVLIVTAIGLAAISMLVSPVDGGPSVFVLTLVGVALAAGRRRFVSRVEGLLVR